ncbi:metallophosphoesterase family protein [Candidatus Woesearchaeota archaeon]|nr:metallophosphoesterase family protein [Candidatus Woesearchaeota archaeon]
MKLLAFTDFHASIVALRKVRENILRHKPDLAVCCGDLTVFEQNIVPVMRVLGAIPVKLLLIHGNHEQPHVVARLAKKYKNIVWLHKRTYRVGDVLFVGYGGQGFVRRDLEFERFMRSIDTDVRKAGRVVLVTHQPPFKTKLDRLYWSYVGNESFSNSIKKHKNIVLALSGHIHETFGKKDKLGNALVLNPGPFGTIVSLP